MSTTTSTTTTTSPSITTTTSTSESSASTSTSTTSSTTSSDPPTTTTSTPLTTITTSTTTTTDFTTTTTDFTTTTTDFTTTTTDFTTTTTDFTTTTTAFTTTTTDFTTTTTTSTTTSETTTTTTSTTTSSTPSSTAFALQVIPFGNSALDNKFVVLNGYTSDDDYAQGAFATDKTAGTAFGYDVAASILARSGGSHNGWAASINLSRGSQPLVTFANPTASTYTTYLAKCMFDSGTGALSCTTQAGAAYKIVVDSRGGNGNSLVWYPAGDSVSSTNVVITLRAVLL
ncbi:hypothetical protein KVT40_002088 [Elsinoe batatas]|uniref:Uncharacterized protein n=1 Tax=Elsinoe batatas TaxID=2601811 RepID=A0A8K0L682_9PEZI|nr:hypothetical protein KVT40_002088 [Elsinoe batatas]